MTDRPKRQQVEQVLVEILGRTAADAWEISLAMDDETLDHALAASTWKRPLAGPRLVQLVLATRTRRAERDHELAVAAAIDEAQECYGTIGPAIAEERGDPELATLDVA